MTTATTRKAAKTAIEPVAGNLRDQVLAMIKGAGVDGLTDEEMQDASAMGANTQRPRRRELVEGGDIVDSRRTRPTRAGHAAVVWVVAEYADLSPAPPSAACADCNQPVVGKVYDGGRCAACSDLADYAAKRERAKARRFTAEDVAEATIVVDEARAKGIDLDEAGASMVTGLPVEVVAPIVASRRDRDRILVIDGKNLFFRAMHGARAKATVAGEVVRRVDEYVTRYPSRVVVFAWDADGPTFRHDLYPAYKAHREPPPPEVVADMVATRSAVLAVPRVAFVESVGFEADDVIATYARQARSDGIDTLIVTTDKDMLQLVVEASADGTAGSIVVFDGIQDKLYSCDADVVAKWGVSPDLLADLLALLGDDADNVPGVKGVGPATAATMLNAHGGLAGLIEAARAGKIKGARGAALVAAADAGTVLAARDLVKLARCAVPSIADLEDLVYGWVWGNPKAVPSAVVKPLDADEPLDRWVKRDGRGWAVFANEGGMNGWWVHHRPSGTREFEPAPNEMNVAFMARWAAIDAAHGGSPAVAALREKIQDAYLETYGVNMAGATTGRVSGAASSPPPSEPIGKPTTSAPIGKPLVSQPIRDPGSKCVCADCGNGQETMERCSECGSARVVLRSVAEEVCAAAGVTMVECFEPPKDYGVPKLHPVDTTVSFDNPTVEPAAEPDGATDAVISAALVAIRSKAVAREVQSFRARVAYHATAGGVADNRSAIGYLTFVNDRDTVQVWSSYDPTKLIGSYKVANDAHGRAVSADLIVASPPEPDEDDGRERWSEPTIDPKSGHKLTTSERGGLAACVVCNGAEGSLTTTCYGSALDSDVLERVHRGGLDFSAGAWLQSEDRVCDECPDPKRCLADNDCDIHGADLTAATIQVQEKAPMIQAHTTPVQPVGDNPNVPTGYATVLCAFALEAFTRTPARLVWDVDLNIDLAHVDKKYESDSELRDARDRVWFEYIDRFKGAVERRMDDPGALAAVDVRVTCDLNPGDRVQPYRLVFSTPLRVNMAHFAHVAPSVGRWALAVSLGALRELRPEDFDVIPF